MATNSFDYNYDVVYYKDNIYHVSLLSDLVKSYEWISDSIKFIGKGDEDQFRKWNVIKISDIERIDFEITNSSNITLINALRTIELKFNRTFLPKSYDKIYVFDLWVNLENVIDKILVLKEIEDIAFLYELLELSEEKFIKTDMLLISNEIIVRVSSLNVTNETVSYCLSIDDNERNAVLLNAYKAIFTQNIDLKGFVYGVLCYFRLDSTKYILNSQLLFDNLIKYSIGYLKGIYFDNDTFFEEMTFYISTSTNKNNITYTRILLLMVFLEKANYNNDPDGFVNLLLNDLRFRMRVELIRLYNLFLCSDNTVYIYDFQTSFLDLNSANNITNYDYNLCEKQIRIRNFQKSNNIYGYMHDFFIKFLFCIRNKDDNFFVDYPYSFFLDISKSKISIPVYNYTTGHKAFDHYCEIDRNINYLIQCVNIVYLSKEFFRFNRFFANNDDYLLLLHWTLYMLHYILAMTYSCDYEKLKIHFSKKIKLLPHFKSYYKDLLLVLYEFKPELINDFEGVIIRSIDSLLDVLDIFVFLQTSVIFYNVSDSTKIVLSKRTRDLKYIHSANVDLLDSYCNLLGI